MSIKDNLQAIAEVEIKDRNFVNHFLTFRQQRGEVISDPDVMSIAGQLLSIAWRKTLKKGSSLEKYIESCSERLKEKISDSSFESVIAQMYFNDNAKGLYQVSPEFLLFKTAGFGGGNTKHVGNVLGNMLLTNGSAITPSSHNVNFLESELIDELKDIITDFEPPVATIDYLPFLSKVFAEDMAILSQYPNYMMQNLKAFISLYNFLYSAQLAMNVRGWSETPSSKPLFFILDTERASVERTHVREALPALLNRVECLFPVLSALEYLNQSDSKASCHYPLWMHYQYVIGLPEVEQTELVSDLRNFLHRYRDKRQREPWAGVLDTAEDVFKAIVQTAMEIFKQPRSSQLTVNRKVVGSFENEVARHFIQNRKRGGRILIMSQDYLLLLTNLAIGRNDKIQYQLLLREFKRRGVWFDQQSQQALIEFYERVGNLERMSDSGDAVYVRKTI